jgi:hypothetical protein
MSYFFDTLPVKYLSRSELKVMVTVLWKITMRMVAKSSFREKYFLEKSRKAATLYEAKSFIRTGTLQYPESFQI